MSASFLIAPFTPVVPFCLLLLAARAPSLSGTRRRTRTSRYTFSSRVSTKDDNAAGTNVVAEAIAAAPPAAAPVAEAEERWKKKKKGKGKKKRGDDFNF